MYYLLHSTVRYTNQVHCIVFIASTKIREREGVGMSPSSFYGKLPDYQSQVLAYSTEGMSSLFVRAVPSPQTYTAVSGVVQFSLCGVFVGD